MLISTFLNINTQGNNPLLIYKTNNNQQKHTSTKKRAENQPKKWTCEIKAVRRKGEGLPSLECPSSDTKATKC